jgi:hypothetical protein
MAAGCWRDFERAMPSGRASVTFERLTSTAVNEHGDNRALLTETGSSHAYDGFDFSTGS